ncbi:BnaCnng12270D [Brassica napus]|uniref:BnaCnng12270D protein n=1 Tax=Brassica napus TaxID=3708 RepID=A0A078I4Q2_BRANA|nr:BnaCnng12270D [Brassica napus]
MATAVEKTKPSQSPPPPPTSFSSLPHDVVLNCLARVSRSYSPILSLVSKSFRTLMSSPELHATRALIGKTEYVCLDLDNNNSKPHWFTLSQIPKQQKLIPISLTHHKRSISVVDSPEEQENQKRVDPRLWNSSVSYSPNCEYLEELQKSTGIKDCGEVYNPKIQMWEPLSPTVDLDGLKKCVPLNICTVEGDNNCTVEGDNNVRYEISVEKGKLVWRNIVEVAVWWKTVEVGRQGRPYTLQFKTNIWCVEISFEMRPCLHPSGLQFDDELWGFVEWSKSVVFTFDGCDSSDDFFLHSAIVTL